MSIIMDGAATQRALANFGRQVPYATAVALNRTAEDANAAIAAHLRSRFVIREPKVVRFVAPQQIPGPFRASKQRLSVTLQTTEAGHILDAFEYGIAKRQASHLSPVAIPTQELRPSGREVIPRKLYPQNLGLSPKKEAGGKGVYFALGRKSIRNKLTPFQSTAQGTVQIKGKLRTFVLDPSYHRNVRSDERGVYQRFGPGKGDIRMIWQYQRSVPRPKTLEFVATGTRIYAERYGANFAGALSVALRTAR